MNKDLEWLARNVQDLPKAANFIKKDNDLPKGYNFSTRADLAGKHSWVSKQQWHQVRQDLGLIMTEEEEEMGNNDGCNEKWSKWYDWDKSPQSPRSVSDFTPVQIINVDEEVKPCGNYKLCGRDIEWKEVIRYRFKTLAHHTVGDCKQQQPAQEVPHSKYMRQIKPGVHVDVYDVLQAWGVSNPALQHLIKKALQPGERGHKSKVEDMADIVASALRAEKLEGGK